MTLIKSIKAREIIDSRGNPTVECDIFFNDNSFGRASVPSGASTGKYEAVELRDNEKRFFGKGVQKAIFNILEVVSPKLTNRNFENIKKFDEELIQIDGTKNKSNLGANATLALSLAFAKAIALKNNIEFFKFIGQKNNFVLPVPMMNIINGGAHADNLLDFQEFMIAPIGAPNFREAIRFGCEIFHSLKSNLHQKGLNTNVGDEGGFAPSINSPKEVIELIINSVEQTGLKMNQDILISLDVASTEFYQDFKYNLEGENRKLSSDEMINYLKDLVNSYPIYSIEDGLSEDDWSGWENLTKEIGNKIQLVGDDLFVTNINKLQEGIDRQVGNSILVKLNQIGTLTETLQAIELAKKNKYSCIISHRSGETEDTTISDLAVATSAGQIKTGSLSRSDRTAKYNQLLRIEELLGATAIYAGKKIIKY